MGHFNVPVAYTIAIVKAALILWYWRDIPVLALDGLTLVGAVVCGFISWRAHPSISPSQNYSNPLHHRR